MPMVQVIFHCILVGLQKGQTTFNPKTSGLFCLDLKSGGGGGGGGDSAPPRILAAERRKILKFGTYVEYVNTNVLTKLQYWNSKRFWFVFSKIIWLFYYYSPLSDIWHIPGCWDFYLEIFWYFSRSWTEFSPTNFIFIWQWLLCISSHGRFPVKLSNYSFAEAPSDPLLNLAFKPAQSNAIVMLSTIWSVAG